MNPVKGVSIRVDPIKNRKDIAAIKKIIAASPRNTALFILGINTNLRASDLLALDAQQVKGLNPGDTVRIRERKTKKERMIHLNRASVKAISDLLASDEFAAEDPLFKTKSGARLSYHRLYRMIKAWCAAINLRGNFGTHTLRKTWGYHQRVTYGVDIPTLMVCFNHASQKQTLDYLCIQPEEIRNVFSNEL